MQRGTEVTAHRISIRLLLCGTAVAVSLLSWAGSPGTLRADDAVSAQDGGPGFTGEGWQTAQGKPLGDPRAVKGGAITISIREWPGNLRMAGTGYNTWLNYAVRDLSYQSLLGSDPNTLDYLPQVASHWWISDDKMTYRYRIDPRATWSDGSPITAHDVVASWKMRMDPTLLDPSAVLTYGKLNEPIAKSKYILEVTAKEKNWRNFLYFSGMSILPAKEIGQITGKEYLDKYNDSYTAVSGPYFVRPDDIKKGESLTLTRRNDFWAKDEVSNQGLYNFDRIRFLVVSDPQLAFDKACKGEIDIFYVQKAEWWAKDLVNLPAVKKGWLVREAFFNDSPIGVGGFALNTRKAPLNDVRVRKALQHLYDRKTLIKKFAYDIFKPLNSQYQGGEYQNPNNEMVEYSPQKAVELLASAGYTERRSDGVLMKDGQPLSLTLSWYSPLKEKYLTSYKEACQKVGVEINLERTNPETMWKNLMDRKFEMVDIQWGGLVYPNPETSHHSKLADQNDNNNITGFKNERVDAHFKKYDEAFTQEERRNIVREIDGLIYNEHDYVLGWYDPAQRMMFWNKFGMPEYGLHRTLEWEDAFATWWVDPKKFEELRNARKNGATLPTPPLENTYWLKQTSAAPTSAN